MHPLGCLESYPEFALQVVPSLLPPSLLCYLWGVGGDFCLVLVSFWKTA